MAAVRRGKPEERLANGIALLGMSVPAFWLGVVLVLVFAIAMPVFAASGFVPFSADPLENLRRLVLPAVVLGSGLAAVVMRQTRAAMIPVPPGHRPVPYRGARTAPAAHRGQPRGNSSAGGVPSRRGRRQCGGDCRLPAAADQPRTPEPVHHSVDGLRRSWRWVSRPVPGRRRRHGRHAGPYGRRCGP
ncbi:ABC transporter permease subunit [Streptomyces laculatispora]|uniref:ABC transporter permease subunit n=1 Tax=Streptomyces laculatispora TaxID=887464 RepID=A0ABY9HZC6_9ACTN|nr:ABC transporter permease subunit [Streptomyces laculatispora]WLQ39298.1 ABC transporter permease subunit [Streptomyces laculatispora]